jgi:hypothetical protein
MAFYIYAFHAFLLLWLSSGIDFTGLKEQQNKNLQKVTDLTRNNFQNLRLALNSTKPF